MEKDRSSKIIAIVALVVAVVGLSLGFAAYSKELVIQPSATVKGDESQFNVQFSTQQSTASEGQVAPELSPEADSITGFQAEEANLAATTIDNIKATFVNGKEKQTVTYKFYVYNAGSLDAYLKSVTFAKPSPTCTPAVENGATKDLVDAACSDVKVTVKVHEADYTTTTPNITSKSITSQSGVPITVELSYESSHSVDGDFEVDFGSITLNYSSADGE